MVYPRPAIQYADWKQNDANATVTVWVSATAVTVINIKLASMVLKYVITTDTTTVTAMDNATLSPLSLTITADGTVSNRTQDVVRETNSKFHYCTIRCCSYC